METTFANEHGVIELGCREVVATCGRSYAAIELALCEDGSYRFGLNLMYSHGGFGIPICVSATPYPSESAAREAALDELLRRWPTAWQCEPSSVHAELRAMRAQVEQCRCQPSFL
jgi:hypothetical protein